MAIQEWTMKVVIAGVIVEEKTVKRGRVPRRGQKFRVSNGLELAYRQFTEIKTIYWQHTKLLFFNIYELAL